ncbi:MULTISPECIES: hypothetical protein [Niastella]|uniref:Haem-binding uptake Tiki superfamily ChaN domain-containing protein n=1 Tax=Niastella soli TaxID=2821487 RepID=A0ABS3Z2I4_9BACT|nr:hypothetical protein [Niastella soli]MBO9204376.1 hypothetical protein [Niastella soli]
MKQWIMLLLVVTFFQGSQPYTGNPRYDFPERIVKKNGTGFGYLTGNMNDLCVSGYYRESNIYEDSVMGPADPVKVTLKNQMQVDARELILKEAKKYRILLINEAHHRPEHRLFTKSLLKDLHKIGYNVFMAEGIKLKNGIADIGYPISSDGVFINEPVYGSLIRYAKRIGYDVNAYEYDSGKKNWDDSIKLDKYGSIKYINYEPRDSIVLLFDEKGLKQTILTSVRERAQAANILEVIKRHPASRFVIHVGYGHLYESGPMMATQLKELLQGEEMLTIDQTAVTDRVRVIDTVTSHIIRRYFPFILKDNNSKRTVNLERSVDYLIFNKEVTDSLHRPKYLFEDVEPRTTYYPSTDNLKDCPCLFSAYYQNELEAAQQQAIAVDIVNIKDAHIPAPMLLYKGRYIIVRKNKEGIYNNFKLTVK